MTAAPTSSGPADPLARDGRVRRLVPRDPIVRRLATITLINTLGNGLFFTLSALYFTRIVGLSIAQVGLGLTIGGAFGVAAGVPFGHAADRLGTRTMLVALVLVEAAGMVAYTFVDSFAAFLVIVSLTTIADRASSAVRSAMYAVVLPSDTRTQVRAYLRAITNVGIGAGSAMSAVALQADTRVAYVALILVNAATYLVAAALILRLPVGERQPEDPASDGRRRNRALKDLPYLVVTGLNVVLALQFGMIEVGVPLWVVGHTHAPRVMVGATLLLNTVLVVFLQVRASRAITTVASAARAGRRGGLLLIGCCLLFAWAHGLPAWPASLLLLAAIVVQTLAEVLCSAAGWALGYDLADPAVPGAYQGVYTSGFALAGMLAPLIVTSTALHFAFLGWLMLAGIFASAGLALVPASRWAAGRLPAPSPEPVG